MDRNGQIAALLRDFAAIQKSKQSMWGYKRAAAAILALEQPIESLLNPDGTLQKIPNIGPSSTRIILEVLRTGTSPTIEAAIAASGQATDVERRRGLRSHFLSRATRSSRVRGSRTIAAIFRCIRPGATAARRSKTSSRPESAWATSSAP
jgi:hypothetical protein